MLSNKNFALFLDVNNCVTEFSQYTNVIEQIGAQGKIVYGKIYGVSEKKNREIIDAANAQGFDTALPMRTKKRGGKKEFDSRIAVDVAETVLSNPAVDAVAIAAAPSDMVYLYRFLKKYDISVVAVDNADEASMNLVDAILDLGVVEVLQPPKATAPKAPRKRRAKKAAEPVAEESPAEEPVTEPAPAEEVAPVAEEPAPKAVADEANDLLKEVEEIRSENDAAATSPAAEEAQSEAQERPAEPDEQPQEDDLIKKIEEMKSGQQEDDEAELIKKIKSLLDGIE